MKKLLFAVVLISLVLSLSGFVSAGDVPGTVISSPCDKAMTENQFAEEYQSKEATFAGFYQQGTVVAFEVEDQLICTTTTGLSGLVGEVDFIQDVKEDNGQGVYHYRIYLTDERYNGYIGLLTGKVEKTDSDGYFGVTLHNHKAIEIPSKPKINFTALGDADIKQLEGKEVEILWLGNSNDQPGWSDACFIYEKVTFCYQSDYIENVKTVVDITGAKVKSEGVYDGRQWLIPGSKAKITFVEYTRRDSRVDMDYKRDYLVFDIGELAKATQYGDPMVLELSSHKVIDNNSIDFNGYGSRFTLMSVVNEPKDVELGYSIAPTKYINGGELAMGKTIGKIKGEPIVVIGMECAFNGAIQPIQYFEYTFKGMSKELEGVVVDLNSYIFVVDENGANQEITYFHIPGGCPAYSK